MKNIEMIEDIFNKTKEILRLWTDYGAEYTENPQVSHILYYLSLTAGYLKSNEEAEVFKKNWNELKAKIKSGSDEEDWLNQSHMINSHLEQALAEESVHHPNDSRNMGIAPFYENKFPQLYENAESEYEGFQKRQDNMVKAMQQHSAEVFATHESWEAALMHGDPAAFCD